MKINKLLLLTPVAILAATGLVSCKTPSVEVKLEDVDQGIKILVDSVSDRNQVSELKIDNFQLDTSNYLDSNKEIAKSKTKSIKRIENYYENSFRRKTLHAEESKGFDSITSTSETNQLTPIGEQNVTDIILKLDNNHNFVYTYQSNDTNKAKVGDYVFDLQQDEELSTKDKSMAYYYANSFLDLTPQKIELSNKTAFDEVLEFVEKKKDADVLDIYTMDNDPTYIRFHYETKDELGTVKIDHTFIDGFISKSEIFEQYEEEQEDGYTVQESVYSIMQFSYVADRFSNPKHTDFLKIKASESSDFPVLNDFLETSLF